MANEMAYQPGVEHPNMMMAVYQAWDTLKVQISYFNQFVAIPSVQFVAWSAGEKATIRTLMG